jgi:Ca2+-transporting ATPase
MHAAVLCNNAILKKEVLESGGKKSKQTPKHIWSIKGDPTEGALVVLGAKAGINESTLQGYQRIKEFPFDSERKRMSIAASYPGGALIYTKGAPDVLLEQCNYILWDNKVIPFTSTLRNKVMAANEGMARSALRVLGLAYREMKVSESLNEAEQAEINLVFIGLTGMIDPPRKEVREAIVKCRKAGIRTIMITGDHRTTAEAIAKQLGMLPPKGLTLEGKQLALMSEEQLDALVEDVYVYARVSPEHKLNIVKALQRKGHVVAMTGDGVNDAPAIKAADIGIAMGISGTDVAKEASSLILSDDNFATIVAAIEEGRGIYENIRKFIRYLLASNVGEILTMFFAMMLALPLPLLPIQILWVNLVTDGLPAMALGVDQAEKDLMQHPPRSAKENIFARRLGWKIISRGFLIGICTLGAFWLTLRNQPEDAVNLLKAQSVAFATLVMAQLIHVFDCRSSRSIFHRNPLQNRYLVLSVFSSVVLLLGVLYISALQPIFKTVALDWMDWILVLIAAGIPTFFMGIGSVLQTPSSRKKISYRTKTIAR